MSGGAFSLKARCERLQKMHALVAFLVKISFYRPLIIEQSIIMFLTVNKSLESIFNTVNAEFY